MQTDGMDLHVIMKQCQHARSARQNTMHAVALCKQKQACSSSRGGKETIHERKTQASALWPNVHACCVYWLATFVH